MQLGGTNMICTPSFCPLSTSQHQNEAYFLTVFFKQENKYIQELWDNWLEVKIYCTDDYFLFQSILVFSKAARPSIQTSSLTSDKLFWEFAVKWSHILLATYNSVSTTSPHYHIIGATQGACK